MEKKRRDLFCIEGLESVVTRLYRAKIKDFEEICRLYESKMKSRYCTWDTQYPTRALLMSDIERGQLYVLNNEKGDIVAAVCICKDEEIDALSCWRGETESAISIMRLAVTERYLNHGVARLVLSLCMNQVKRNGARSIRFLVGKNNQPALRSYRKLLFDEVGMATLFGEDWICFEKELLTQAQLARRQERKKLQKIRAKERQREINDEHAEKLKKHEVYMRQAITQAKKAAAIGEVPIGCVIVHEGKVIGRGYNRRNADKSTLSHAEMTAIRKASKAMQDWRLEGCTLYVTLEPCQMCAGAIVQARIREVVIGAMNPKAGCAGSILNILQMKEFNHQVKTTTGVCEEECSQILKKFFADLRDRNI